MTRAGAVPKPGDVGYLEDGATIHGETRIQHWRKVTCLACAAKHVMYKSSHGIDLMSLSDWKYLVKPNKTRGGV